MRGGIDVNNVIAELAGIGPRPRECREIVACIFAERNPGSTVFAVRIL